jgi:oligoribonuclease NrnB/cAMP/cGMP phosphodiesterase (DHH superfamily)
MNNVIVSEANRAKRDFCDIKNEKDLQPDEVDAVIYHDPCSDGFGACVIAQQYLSTKFPEKEILYFPMSHGASFSSSLEGRNLLICDFSFRKNILLELKKKVKKLLILDHHATAEKDLLDLDDKDKWFDMGHSGAMLTWFYFYPTEEPPLLIKYIEDRDIWAKKLVNTDAFVAWFYMLPFDFNEYQKYFDDKLLLEMIDKKGKLYEELNEYYINQAIEYSVVKFCEIKGKYYFVAFVNFSVCKSDIGNNLLNKFPLCDFSAIYNIDKNDSTYFSLRSTEVHVNVGDLAFSLNAGGHRNASGIKINDITNHLPGAVLDKGKLFGHIQDIYFDTLIINEITYNIVYFSWSAYKTKLARYFLQTKYITKENVSIPIWKDIAMKTNKTHPENIHISAVWNYNPVEDTTKFSIVLDKSVNEQSKENIDKWLGCDINQGLKCNGFHKLLLMQK